MVRVEARFERQPAHDGIGAAEMVKALRGELRGHDLEAVHGAANVRDADDAIDAGAAVDEIGASSSSEAGTASSASTGR